MASLTESYLISEQLCNPTPSKPNDWFNRVYLCLETTNSLEPNSYSAIRGFECYKFNTFESADYAWRININSINYKNNIRHTMIPVCKWVPQIFDKYVLNWKLRNTYWLGNISINHGPLINLIGLKKSNEIACKQRSMEIKDKIERIKKTETNSNE